MIRYRPGLSFKASVIVERLAGCVDNEHRFDCVDDLSDPKYFRCRDCKVYAFIRRKGGVLRNGRYVLYTCSYKKCKRPARIRSKYRVTGGAFDWACCPDHAPASKFEGRVHPEEFRNLPRVDLIATAAE